MNLADTEAKRPASVKAHASWEHWDFPEWSTLLERPSPYPKAELALRFWVMMDAVEACQQFAKRGYLSAPGSWHRLEEARDHRILVRWVEGAGRPTFTLTDIAELFRLEPEGVRRELLRLLGRTT